MPDDVSSQDEMGKGLRETDIPIDGDGCQTNGQEDSDCTELVHPGSVATLGGDATPMPLAKNFFQDLPTNIHKRVTPERIKTFIDMFARTGSFHAASRAASPHATGPTFGLQTWRDLIQRDPEFAALCDQARSHALGKVEETIAIHALEGVEEPIYQQGRLVGTKLVFDHKLLLRLAERLDSNTWAQRSKIEHSGHVDLDLNTPLSIDPQDLLLLSPYERTTLIDLIRKIDDLKGPTHGSAQ